MKPSGRPHIGTVATLVAAFDYVARNSDTTINLQIMDLDFDAQRGNPFIPFIHQTNESGRTVREALRVELAELVDIMSDIYAVDLSGNMRVDYFSEFLSVPKTLDKFLSIFLDEGKATALNNALFDRQYLDRLPISGICPSCHTSSSAFAKRSFGPRVLGTIEKRMDVLHKNDLGLETAIVERELAILEKRKQVYEGRLKQINESQGGGPEYFLRSECANNDCAVESYDFDLRHGFYNIHYLVDPLRDEIMDSQGHLVHIFGGDYAQPHGPKRIPKAERIRNALIAVQAMNQDFFIGPQVTYKGEKMGKSGVAITFRLLSHKRQKLIVEYIHELYDRGSREIEYEDIAKRI